MRKNENIRDKIDELAPWFHNIHLPGGISTAPDHPLGDFPLFKWEQISPHLPDDMSGMKVLDIGCNAGFYSIECARRGATVTAIDVDPHYLKQARWIAGLFDLSDHIEFHLLQVYDLAGKDWEFDIILFMGVFYHLRYPMLALDIISEKVSRMVVFQSLSTNGEEEHAVVEDFGFNDREIMEHKSWPSMAFIERKFLDDPTNWWVPNKAAIKAMFRTAGFMFIKQPGHEIYIFAPDSSNLSVINRWNKSEFLSATGRYWQHEAEAKTGKK